MKTILLGLFLSGCFSVSFAQNNCSVKKGTAYYTSSIPGAQMADENGNPVPPKPVITRFIYLEYSGIKVPAIKSVSYNGVELSLTVISVKEKTAFPDKEQNPGEVIKAKKGNSLLKIDLQPEEGKTMPATGSKSIIVKYKTSGKLCRFYIFSEKRLETLPMY
ncbi:MAG: hypothetical protein JNM14_15995 [Ferruginibacter sp.]|nr:hypothetical protein [Ferruginibacter sp.]